MIDLDSASRGEIDRILDRHLPGIEVRLVGSRANGPAKRYADIDLLVMCDEPLPVIQRALLNNAFEESALPFRVDVMEWPCLSPSFRARLLPGSVPLGRHAVAV